MLNIERELLSQNEGWTSFADYLQKLLTCAPVPFVGGTLSLVRARGAKTKSERFIAGLLVLETRRKTPRRSQRYPSFELSETWLSQPAIIELVSSLETDGSSRHVGGKFQQRASVSRIYSQSPLECATQWAETQAAYRLAGETREPEYRPVVAYAHRPYGSWKAAAMDWFRVHPDRSRGEVPYKHYLVVVVPELRGRISSYELGPTGALVVSVETAQRGPWQISYSCRRSDNTLTSGSAPVVKGAATVPISPEGTTTDLWLVHRSIGPLSHVCVYHHDLLPTGTPEPQPSERARQDIRGGESDTVEFKPFLRSKDHQDKLHECMKTITAFANTRGGRIYVGVRNDCTLEGTQVLCTAMSGNPDTARDAQQLLFARGVGDLIDPCPEVEYEWLTVGGENELLLCIIVRPTRDVHAYKDATVLVRRGSSNRQAFRGELRELFRERQAVEPTIKTEDDLW